MTIEAAPVSEQLVHPTESIIDRDLRMYKQTAQELTTRSIADLALRVRAESGRSLGSILLEFRRLALGPGRLTPLEYVQYRLWELPVEERSRFLSDKLHWPVVHAAGDRRCEAMAEDKWLAASLLQSAGIPAVHCLAVVDRSARAWVGIPVLRTGAELAELCRSVIEEGGSVFGKPVCWLGGFGALLVDGADGSRLHLASEGWLEADAVVETCIGTWPYLLQICEPAHPELADLSERLPVVRISAWVRDSGPELHWPVMRTPGRHNAFSQGWLPGNLLYALDIETGQVVRATFTGLGDLVVRETHPDSGVALPGYRLPQWPEVLALAERAARVFAPLRYHSIEIGLARRGPVVVEVNTGGGFRGWQLPSGQGLLEPRFVEFLDECGVRLESARRRWSRRRPVGGDDPFHWTRASSEAAREL